MEVGSEAVTRVVGLFSIKSVGGRASYATKRSSASMRELRRAKSESRREAKGMRTDVRATGGRGVGSAEGRFCGPARRDLGDGASDCKKIRRR